MPGSKDDTLELEQLKYFFGRTPIASITTYYVALYHVEIDEVVASWNAHECGTIHNGARWSTYARVAVANSHASWLPASTNGGLTGNDLNTVYNTIPIRFPKVVIESGTLVPIKGVGLWTQSTGGTRVRWGNLIQSFDLKTNNKPLFPYGSFVLTEK